RLVFAEATRLDGAIGALLDRPALGGGARATALMLAAGPQADALVEPLRAAFAPHAEVEAGVSVRDGIVVARALARSPERLRVAMVAALATAGVDPLPRVWS
ncbi:MAG: urease accessory protein UreD, partial [Caulobacteraceae bacterium]|nr:urease accessory protein UreD [Caulobacter sp.]